MSTYTPIATQTLSSSAATVTFTGIPQTYTDLVLVFCGTGDNGDMYLQFNSDTGTNYSVTNLYGNGSSAGSNRASTTSVSYTPGVIRSSTISTSTTHIMNYANTTTNKTFIGRAGSADYEVMARVALWRGNNEEIKSIQVKNTGGNIYAGSTFTLYGIGSGSPKAFGGDEVRTDGTYWYHIYRSSGIFAPMQNLSCDYLVVGGGGGAGSWYGGGGGAGGYRTGTLSITGGTNQTVTIGAGGTGGAGSGPNRGTVGTSSVFASITADRGGEGATDGTLPGGNGGSGGGGSDNGLGGTATSGQGNNGGNGFQGTTTTSAGGGGGGAGAAGDNATSGDGGNGGNGSASSITGSSVTYAGGGGGGTGLAGNSSVGGTGGGGNGGPSATPGTANTGGGGGAGARSNLTAGQSGGSGIVVVRYAV